MVVFIHREDKFTTEEEWVRDNPGLIYPRGLAEMIIAKHRNGPTGSVELAVSDAWGRFQDNSRRPIDAQA